MRYNEIKETPVTEVKMSPGRIDQALAGMEDVRAGFEAELIFPNRLGGERGTSSEENFEDHNEDATSIGQIIRFFDQNGENTDYALNALQEKMTDDYFAWREEQVNEILATIEEQLGAENLVKSYQKMYNEAEDSAKREIFNIDAVLVDLDTEEALKEIARRIANPRKTLGFTPKAVGNANNLIHKFFDSYLADKRRINQAPWLESEGIETMFDVYREGDVNWPFHDEVDDDDSETFSLQQAETLASNLSDDLGISVEASAGYHQATRTDTGWIIEPDSSLEPDESEDMGTEIVSPPMPLAEAIRKMSEVLAWAKENGAYTNESTGLHVGVSFPGIGGRVDYIKLALFLGDEYVLEKFGRDANTYCRSAVVKIKDTISDKQSDKDTADEMIGVVDLLRNGMADLATKIIRLETGHNKYTSINMKGDYIEFRSMGGDYIDKVESIIATMKRYVYAMSIAADSTTNQREYATKLYKLMSSTNAQKSIGVDEFYRLFSLYNSGEINKEAMIQGMYKLRIARDKAKNAQATTNYLWKVYCNWRPEIMYISAPTEEAANQIAQQQAPKEWDEFDKRLANAEPIKRIPLEEPRLVEIGDKRGTFTSL